MNLESIAVNILEPLGFEVLEVQVQNAQRSPIVVVRIDRLDEQPVTTEDLQLCSQTLGLEFDRLDPIKKEYRLEFESPGPKRPLKRARHFERMLGLKAKVRSSVENFTAPIKEVSGDMVTFAHGDEGITLRIGDFQANLAEFPDRHR